MFYRRCCARFLSVAVVAAGCVFSVASLAADTTDGKLFTQVPEVAPTAEQPTPAAPEDPATKKAFSDGPAPSWIWGADPNKKYFARKTFKGTAQFALLKAACDNSVTVWVNGEKVASGETWQAPAEADLKSKLKPGENVIEAEITNQGGPAGFIAKIALTGRDGTNRFVVTDDSWEIAETRDAKEWSKARIVARLGAQPWGDVFANAGLSGGGQRDLFNLPPGFQVERLFTVPKETLGSWVNIATDPKGRLIVSDQGDKGFCRITPPPIGSQEPTKVELLDIKFGNKLMSGAQGLLWAFDSLYVVCNGGPGSGLYRCKDTDGDDQFDKVELLKSIPGGGEHGPHAVRLSPDGKSLFIAAGNHTHLPFEIKTNAPPQTMGGQRTEQLRATLPEGLTSRLMPNWDEDLLLPRQWDGGGHATGVLAPGGWICKIDPDGKNWEIFSSGYRNEFDFAFNADGEMFAYDADMEWDFGSPWYRPTRVVHATSGSEFGWRSGTGKWPSYYIDSLPELINIGPGCPVGVEFGYGTKFPARYQKALYICDWTFGTMYAIHIEPSGSSYKATKEEFVSRTPLPLTDCTVGHDGALYFTIGGRGAQSELFRVTYVGQEDISPVDAKDTSSDDRFKVYPREWRAMRHNVEKYHSAGHDTKDAVVAGLQHLGHWDRHLSTAARVALERLPLALWQDAVFAAPDKISVGDPSHAANPGLRSTAINGCVALARQGERQLLPKIVATLGKLDFKLLTVEQQLGLLRAYQLAFIRLGNPDMETCAVLAKKFDDLFPQKSDFVNRELAILMIHFQSPGAVQKLMPLLALDRSHARQSVGEPATDSNRSQADSAHSLATVATGALLERNKGYGGAVAAMLANQPDQQQYFYAFNLRTLKTGWTFEDRKAYFAWFDKARGWSGGASYPKFLNNIDNEAFALLTDAERLKIEASGSRKPYVAPELPKAKGPGREYSLDELLALSADKMKGRDFKNGQKMFAAARCIVCHRFGGDGGATGPDLTQLAGRYSLKDMAESIVDPSKVVSDQFKATIVETKLGKAYTGQLILDTKDSITLLIDPENTTKTVEIKKSDIEEQQLSATSMMPKDLLKTLNENEALDLLAYLMSRGNPGDAMFRK